MRLDALFIAACVVAGLVALAWVGERTPEPRQEPARLCNQYKPNKRNDREGNVRLMPCKWLKLEYDI